MQGCSRGIGYNTSLCYWKMLWSKATTYYEPDVYCSKALFLSLIKQIKALVNKVEQSM